MSAKTMIPSPTPEQYVLDFGHCCNAANVKGAPKYMIP